MDATPRGFAGRAVERKRIGATVVYRSPVSSQSALER